MFPVRIGSEVCTYDALNLSRTSERVEVAGLSRVTAEILGQVESEFTSGNFREKEQDKGWDGHGFRDSALQRSVPHCIESISRGSWTVDARR